MAQIFNDPSASAGEKGKVEVVWGSCTPGQPEGVYHLYYHPFNRDADGGTGATHHVVTWFLANHPDWIEYACDEKSVAYETNNRNVPVDKTNPAILDDMIRTYLFPAIQQGHRGIAFDDIDFVHGRNRCGVRRNGNWVEQPKYVVIHSIGLHTCIQPCQRRHEFSF